MAIEKRMVEGGEGGGKYCEAVACGALRVGEAGKQVGLFSFFWGERTQ